MVEYIPSNGLFVPPLPSESPLKPPEPPLPASQIISEDLDYHSQELQFSKPLVCIKQCYMYHLYNRYLYVIFVKYTKK